MYFKRMKRVSIIDKSMYNLTGEYTGHTYNTRITDTMKLKIQP